MRKEFPMQMQATLGNPILVAVYSTALLLFGCAIGRWVHPPATALWLATAGGILMALHDSAMGILWFWLTARWVRSVIHHNKRG